MGCNLAMLYQPKKKQNKNKEKIQINKTFGKKKNKKITGQIKRFTNKIKWKKITQNQKQNNQKKSKIKK